MDRRNFLEAILVSPTAVPVLDQSQQAPQHQASPRAPQGPNPRVRQNLNDAWRFERQSKGTGALGSFDRENGAAADIEPRFREAHRTTYDDSEWTVIDLPHTWNAFDVSGSQPGYWRGLGWYRKYFKLESALSQKRVFLEFEGVNSVSEFWLNGENIGRHAGGYTSFEFDITPHARFEPEGNVLTVKVDNLFHGAVPPTVKTDYAFYGGIYRDVWLRLSEPTYIIEVIWNTPEVSKESAELHLESRILNSTLRWRDFTLVHEIIDHHQQIAKTTSSTVRVAAGEVAVDRSSARLDSPLLWSPEIPNLYRIRTTLRDSENVIDVVENPLGFRWFKFDSQQGFILNGKRVQIQGTNWHQSYPGMGIALPNSRHVKDMELIREMGANFWRTSHYPHDPAALEASARLGLMVWEELPINKEIGNPDEYLANVLKMAEEMIRRDRNNPSVITWGIAGEINAPAKLSRQVVGAVAEKYRQLDPTRPVIMHEPRGDEIEALLDVIGLGANGKTDAEHQRYPRRCYMTSEYAVATIGRGIYGMGPESEELGCRKHEEYLRMLYEREWMAGGLIWHQLDFEGDTYDTVTPHINSWGMADIWRIPKEVFYFYQSQWLASLMVRICGHWTWPGEEGKTKEVKVFSNAPEVELFLNRTSLGTKKDSQNAGLPHPPRIWQVPYQPGTLRAEARDGTAGLSDERKTAGPAHHIVLESDLQELRSGDRESLAYINASIVDAQGTVVPSATHPIAFTSYGPGELLPQTWLGFGTGLTWGAVAGRTRIAFRATNRTGHAVISAVSPGLGMGRVRIAVLAPGRPDEMEYVERFENDEP